MLKRWKANRKLKKYRRDHPKQNINEHGNIIIDECHLVCFVNDNYPSEHQMLGLVDATSKWFYSHGSSREVLRWADRRSNPIVYKSADHYELERIKNQITNISDKISLSFFAGEIIAVCIGPIWHSRLDNFSFYEYITYE